MLRSTPKPENDTGWAATGGFAHHRGLGTYKRLVWFKRALTEEEEQEFIKEVRSSTNFPAPTEDALSYYKEGPRYTLICMWDTTD